MKAKPKKRKSFIMPSVLLGGNVSTIFNPDTIYEVERMSGDKVILNHSDKYDTSTYQFRFDEVELIP